ncbi:MAG: heme NO-binding domain-containing protein [Verrucomicrobiota bacterium]
MKGVVFTEFLEMVEDQFSDEIADELLDSCDLPSGGTYTAVGTYDHSEMVTLIVRLSELTGQSTPELIHVFGLYLFGRFTVLYPSFLEGVNSCMDFLEGIEDIIHAEVKKLYPDAQLPKFDVERPDRDTLIMIYRSERHLGDLAHGLIEQCITHFGESIHVKREDLEDQEGSPVRFTLSKA